MRLARIAILITITILTCSSTVTPAAEMPTSVIHVITVKWKEGTTDEQIKKAYAGGRTPAKMYNGIKRIWLRPISVQGTPIGKCDTTGVTHAIVMEFESEAALRKYADSDAQKAFYEAYLPIRDQSRTHDISN